MTSSTWNRTFKKLITVFWKYTLDKKWYETEIVDGLQMEHATPHLILFTLKKRKKKKKKNKKKKKKKKKKNVFMRYQLATTIHEYMNQKAWCIDVRALIPRWLAEVFLKSVRDNISLWHR